MPLFRFSAAITVSAYTEVYASTVEEAMQIARTRRPVIDPSCVQEHAFWSVPELDGIPMGITHTDTVGLIPTDPKEEG